MDNRLNRKITKYIFVNPHGFFNLGNKFRGTFIKEMHVKALIESLDKISEPSDSPAFEFVDFTFGRCDLFFDFFDFRLDGGFFQKELIITVNS